MSRLNSLKLAGKYSEWITGLDMLFEIMRNITIMLAPVSKLVMQHFRESVAGIPGVVERISMSPTSIHIPWANGTLYNQTTIMSIYSDSQTHNVSII